MEIEAWVVRSADGTPSWTTDHAHATDYASLRHGTYTGPMPLEEAQRIVLSYHRALLNGASPMETH